jgi:hypothetical protein
MKLTIIREDGAVYKDGVSYSSLDLADIPSDIHALQFNDAANAGWIEFAQDDFGAKAANEMITSLPAWATTAISKWDEAKAAEEAAIEAARIAKEQAVANTTTQL